MDVAEARAAIAEQFPWFPLRTLTGPRSGFRNWCFLADGEWIFRFPKDAEAARELRCELLALSGLRNRSGVAFPSCELFGEPSEHFPRRFAAYRAIAGDGLRREVLESLPAGARERIAGQIGGFLADLHDHPLDEARAAMRAAGLKLPQSSLEWFTDGGRAFRRKLNEKLDEVRHHPDFTRFRELLRRLLDDPEIYREEEGLVHGDLTATHILFCPERQEVTGFIDFGSLSVGDGFADFMRLADLYGMDFCFLALRGYRRTTAPLMEKKLRTAQAVLETLADFRRLLRSGV